jgi:tetratricopeptide (TPR) repeat protein
MALVNLGLADILLSDHERARQSLVRGLALAREVDSESQADATNLLGAVDLATGHLSEAMTRFQLALSAYERQHDLPQQNRARNNIAGVLMALGRYDEAIAAYQALLRGPGVSHAQVLLNLASAHSLRKDFPAAQELLQQAVKLQRETGDPLLRTSLGNLGAVLAESGDAGSALPVLEQALALDRNFGDRASESSTLIALAQVNARLGRPAKALALFAQAAERGKAAGVATAQSSALAGSARVLENQGDLPKALAAALQAVAIDETLRAAGGMEEARTAFAAGAADKQQHAAHLLLKLERPAEAFEMAERSRARTLLDRLGNAHIEVRTDGAAAQEQRTRIELAALNTLVAQQRQMPASQRDPAALEELLRKLADKRRQHELVLLSLKAADPEYAALVDVAVPRLAEVQALLDDETSLGPARRRNLPAVVSRHVERRAGIRGVAADHPGVGAAGRRGGPAIRDR